MFFYSQDGGSFAASVEMSSVFLIGKFGNTAVKMLKSALLDYYDDGALSAAKRQRLKDDDKIKSQVGILLILCHTFHYAVKEIIERSVRSMTYLQY